MDRRGSDECWPWLGKRLRGYGQFPFSMYKPVRAHRYAYELLVGPIPAGLTLDHTCHDPKTCTGGVSCPHRRCVNPAHLEPLSRVENVMRGNTITARNAAKTHCNHGHPFDEINTRIDPKTGFRCCRMCAKLNARRYTAAARSPH